MTQDLERNAAGLPVVKSGVKNFTEVIFRTTLFRRGPSEIQSFPSL